MQLQSSVFLQRETNFLGCGQILFFLCFQLHSRRNEYQHDADNKNLQFLYCYRQKYHALKDFILQA